MSKAWRTRIAFGLLALAAFFAIWQTRRVADAQHRESQRAIASECRGIRKTHDSLDAVADLLDKKPPVPMPDSIDPAFKSYIEKLQTNGQQNIDDARKLIDQIKCDPAHDGKAAGQSVDSGAVLSR